ncbi:MAG: flotillin-like FloA family protein [Candidatus Hydrogenedentes bacterium]|nr:flotillin-like FloA family protein [Candidatus Hydrogenedentota bacterium]
MPGVYALIVIAIPGAVVAVFVLKCCGPWLRALLGGAPVSLPLLIAMRLRRVDPNAIVQARLVAVKGGVDVHTADLETHYLSGGNPAKAVLAAVIAKKAGIDVTFRQAMAFDLAGRDVLDEVQDLVRAKQDGLRAEAGEVSADEAAAWVGAAGQVACAVAPPGIVTVDGRPVHAVSDGGFIVKGAGVEVLEAQGNVVVVRQVPDE